VLQAAAAGAQGRAGAAAAGEWAAATGWVRMTRQSLDGRWFYSRKTCGLGQQGPLVARLAAAVPGVPGVVAAAAAPAAGDCTHGAVALGRSGGGRREDGSLGLADCGGGC